ncbi:hypothetical protein [Peribacillus sp. SCS-155]
MANRFGLPESAAPHAKPGNGKAILCMGRNIIRYRHEKLVHF